MKHKKIEKNRVEISIISVKIHWLLLNINEVK
jgi:hypothetical protein